MKASQQFRPMNFQSKHDSNVPSFQESPSKQFSRTSQNQVYHITTPNFYNKNSSGAVHRAGPINFNTSSSLNKQQSLMINTNPNFGNLNKNLKVNSQQFLNINQGNSLFDRYYKQMLFLSQCDTKDLQVIVKNPVVFEEELKVKSRMQVNPNNKKFIKTQQYISRQASNINEIPLQSKLQPPISYFSNEVQIQNQRSKQFVENQILFNHKKIIAQRRAQKQNFLTNIQSKIEALEKQTEEVQKIRALQRHQLEQIRHLQQGIQSQIGNNKLIGKIDQILLETMHHDSQQKKKLTKKIQQQMQAEQINNIIDEEVKANNDLLEEIDAQLRGRINGLPQETGWRNSKQKSMRGDRIKEKESKINTAVGGFNKNNRSLNSSAGFGSRMTVKETELHKRQQNNNMASTFNKSVSKKIVNTQNSNNKNRSNSKQKN